MKIYGKPALAALCILPLLAQPALAAKPTIGVVCFFTSTQNGLDPGLPPLHLQFDYEQQKGRDATSGKELREVQVSDSGIRYTAPMADRLTAHYSIDRVSGRIFEDIKGGDGALLSSIKGYCDPEGRKF